MQQFEIGVVERHHAVVGLELRERVLETHAAVTQEARDHHREILHERGVHHVAEVDDAVHQLTRGGGAQQVAGVAVGVHHLRAQCGQPWQYLLFQTLQESRRQCERIGLHTRLHPRVQHQGALYVPGHEVARMRVEIAAQALREARLEIRSTAEHRRLQCGARAERLARQPAEQPDHVPYARVVLYPFARVALKRGDEPRYGEFGSAAREVLQRADLEIHSARGLARRRDLEHELPTVGAVHAVVLVALAVQCVKAAADAVVLLQRIGQRLLRELRRIEVEIGGVQPRRRGLLHLECFPVTVSGGCPRAGSVGAGRDLRQGRRIPHGHKKTRNHQRRLRVGGKRSGFTCASWLLPDPSRRRPWRCRPTRRR